MIGFNAVNAVVCLLLFIDGSTQQHCNNNEKLKSHKNKTA